MPPDAAGQLHVGIAHQAGTGVDDAGLHIAIGQFLDGLHGGFNAALDIGLEDQDQLLDIPGIDLLDDVIKGQNGVQVAGCWRVGRGE